MARAKKREELQIAPKTVLGGLLGVSSSRRSSGLASPLIQEAIYPSLRRMWDKPLGRIALYALGVRPAKPKAERENKPGTTRRRSTTKRSPRE
jgi:hypothetical protein